MTTKSIGEIMTKKLETIKASSSAQEAAKKMRDNNVSSLLVIDDKNNNKPIGIVTERDLSRKVCVNDGSSKNTPVQYITSSPLVTIDSISQVEVAADVMLQNKVRHLLVVKGNDINEPLGIISPSDFTAYLKDNLKIDDVNAKILESLEEESATEHPMTATEHPMTATSVSSKPQISSSYTNPKYKTILVPHDGSKMSDKALNHAIYLSNMSGAEIAILHVLEDIHLDSTAVLATSKEGTEGAGEVKDIEKSKKQGYEIRVEGEVKEMIEEKMRFCKQAGVKSQVSYKIQTGKAVDEIIKMCEDVNVDLIVIASSRKPSLTTRLLGSTSRKVIDSIEKPVLIIHG
ncbi:MAG TPA: universal stress protein [Nitrososphaeraceae archaeon]|nr:universal stress protein [Nitrososphaeraceae archaeon]